MTEAIIALWGIAALFWALDKALARYLEVLRVKLKREQLKDRVFRDACDTIHHLRIENDALTHMVMAMQEKAK